MPGLPPELTRADYESLKSFLEEAGRIEARYRKRTGQGFKDSEVAALRLLDEQTAVIRAAVEGYEAVQGFDG